MKNKNDISDSQEGWNKTIRKIRDYAEEQFDKLIVYLNSGALVLTVGFVKDIVKITDKTDTTLLKASWILFTTSLVIILISHKTSVIAMNYELKDNEKISNYWDILTQILNWSSLVVLVGGIISFLLFVSKSI
jgi:uncharacterized beta-barrel protein YwiB (DUF1934 family)